MKLSLITLSSLLLMGCQNAATILTSNRNMVVMPPTELFVCPTISEYPNQASMTDLDVARLIVQLHDNNERCRINIEAIKQFLEAARQVTERPAQ
jgi:uncharacterized protein YcfL